MNVDRHMQCDFLKSRDKSNGVIECKLWKGFQSSLDSSLCFTEKKVKQSCVKPPAHGNY